MVRTYKVVSKRLKDLKSVYQQEGIDYEKESVHILNQSKTRRLEIDQCLTHDHEDRIPFLTHQVYYTFPNDVRKIDNLSLKKSLVTTERLNSVHDFKHYIWTNNKESIPEELSILPGVEVHLIDELKNLRLFNFIESIFNRTDLKLTDLVVASDVTRVIVMRELGGIYHDLDYEIFTPQDLLPMLKNFNFIAGEESQAKIKLISHAFFAATAHHPILNKETELLERNLGDNIEKPDYIKYPYSLFDKLIFTIGPVVISIAFFKENNKDNNIDILLPSYFLNHAEYLWSKTPDSPCHKKYKKEVSLVNLYEGELITTIGADSACGTWHKNLEAHQEIIY